MTVSFAFVIDADIARSSGMTEHPVSRETGVGLVLILNGIGYAPT